MLKYSIPVVPALLASALSTCLMLGCAWWFGLREDVESSAPHPPPSPEMMASERIIHSNYRVFQNSNSKMHERGNIDKPLSKGAALPSLKAGGWLNAAPPGTNAGRALVVDVWDGTCPCCAQLAPTLVELYAKYRNRGVAFVSMTSANRDEALRFVDAQQLSWPNGFDAEATIDALGASAPSLFVVDQDGEIVWNDNRARYRHDVASLRQQIEVAIEEALGRPSSMTR